VAEKMIFATAMVAVVSVILIFLFVGRKALPVLTNEQVRQTANVEEFFTHNGQDADGKPAFVWQPISERPKYSFVPLLVGTFKVLLVAMFVAVPLALLAALYTTEYAPRRLREYIKPAIELLAGIPSVVFGFFALVVLASWIQKVFHFETRLNAVVAGGALGLAIIPVIYTVAEDTLAAVPRTLREASLALGATRAQTLLRVIFPAAIPQAKWRRFYSQAWPIICRSCLRIRQTSLCTWAITSLCWPRNRRMPVRRCRICTPRRWRCSR
ncbi:MAG TPA: ABC transporter permease subunit, partial [Blastocatellia bacterium]|nr:ABC transporter permease subunit [Blastocatellia bacterium]